MFDELLRPTIFQAQTGCSMTARKLKPAPKQRNRRMSKNKGRPVKRLTPCCLRVTEEALKKIIAQTASNAYTHFWAVVRSRPSHCGDGSTGLPPVARREAAVCGCGIVTKL